MKKIIVRVPNENYSEKMGVLNFHNGEAIIEGENIEKGIEMAKAFGYGIEVVEDTPKAAPKKEEQKEESKEAPKAAPKKTTRKAAPKTSEDK